MTKQALADSTPKSKQIFSSGKTAPGTVRPSASSTLSESVVSTKNIADKPTTSNGAVASASALASKLTAVASPLADIIQAKRDAKAAKKADAKKAKTRRKNDRRAQKRL